MLEAYELGLGDPVAISAEHGEGLADLYAALREALPDETERKDTLPDGKSRERDPRRKPLSALQSWAAPIAENRPWSTGSWARNACSREPRPGITRDAIAVDLDWHGRKFRLHDTAGLRRRSRIEEKLEKLSVADALNALRFAEVVILLLDAQTPFEEQDLRIADLVEREGRALVIGMNKWDLVEPRPGAIKKLREEVDHWLPQVRGRSRSYRSPG